MDESSARLENALPQYPDDYYEDSALLLDERSLRKTIGVLARNQSLIAKLKPELWPNSDNLGDVKLKRIFCVNAGVLQTIWEVEYFEPINGGKKIILAVSRGPLQEPEAQEKLKNHRYYLKDKHLPADEISVDWIANRADRQVLFDHEFLGYLYQVFAERGIPIRIPKQYGVVSLQVGTTNKQKVDLPIAIMERLNCAEINPKVIKKNPFAVDGSPILKVNEFTAPQLKNLNKLLTIPEAQRILQRKVIELLSYMYFATGCLPSWFDLCSGDVVLIPTKELMEKFSSLSVGGNLTQSEATDLAEMLKLGLITVRQGFISLDQFRSEAVGERYYKSKTSQEIKIQIDPDLLLLHNVLRGFTTGFYREPSDFLTLKQIKIWDQQLVKEGIANAFRCFYRI